MAMITEEVRLSNGLRINLTYDSSIVEVSFSPENYTKLTFKEGYVLNSTNANIFFKRTGRSIYHLQNVKNTVHVLQSAIVEADGGIIEFVINLILSNGIDYLVDLSNANFTHTPEPDEDLEPVTVEETEVEPIPYDVETIEDNTLYVGVEEIVQNGSDGELTKIYSVTYLGDEEIERELISEKVTKEPTAKIVKIGTLPEPITIRNLFPAYDEGLNNKFEIYFNGSIWGYTIGKWDNVIFENQYLNEGETFTIGFKALDGYAISDILTPYGDWGSVSSDLENWNGNGQYYERSYVVKPDYPSRMDVLIEYRIETIIKETPEVEDFPFIKLYVVELDDLQKLSLTNFEGGLKSSDYMMGLYRIPFKIEGTEETNILLGNTRTDVTAKAIDNYIYNLDLGEIKMSYEVWGGVSFSNVTVELFVMYFDKITLDVDEVINNTLQLELNVNLLNGTGTLNVYSKNTKSLIHISNKQIGQYIPYILGYTVKSEVGSDILINDIINPYVEIKKHIPRNTKELNHLTALQLDDSVFYMQSEQIMLNSKASQSEQNEIGSLLQKGVIVRGHENLKDVNINKQPKASDREQDFWDKWGEHGGLIGGKP